MDATPFFDQFERLHEAAIEAVGGGDFGDADYHQGLRVLLAAIDAGPRLNEVEAATAREMIVEALKGRFVASAGWRRHPEVLETEIRRPLVVIGLPRTGTTALHQLLSLDPQFQGFENWLTRSPGPLPPRETWARNPSYQAAAEQYARLKAGAPEAAAAHSVPPDEVDECLRPMSQSFTSNLYPSVLEIANYDAWFRAQDETPSFRRYADLLKLVGLGDRRPWLLKNPSHLFGVDGLLNAFPDACIVQTHRHPATTIASLTSLLAGLRDMTAGRRVDRDHLRVREIGFWSEAARRGMAAQDRSPERFLNIRQSEIQEDPLGVVERIYGKFGFVLSAAAESAMRQWASAQKAGRPAHAYEPVADKTEIDAAFGPYIERYFN